MKQICFGAIHHLSRAGNSLHPRRGYNEWLKPLAPPLFLGGVQSWGLPHSQENSKWLCKHFALYFVAFWGDFYKQDKVCFSPYLSQFRSLSGMTCCLV